MLTSGFNISHRGTESKPAFAAGVSEDGYCLLGAKTILGARASELSLGTL